MAFPQHSPLKKNKKYNSFISSSYCLFGLPLPRPSTPPSINTSVVAPFISRGKEERRKGGKEERRKGIKFTVYFYVRFRPKVRFKI